MTTAGLNLLVAGLFVTAALWLGTTQESRLPAATPQPAERLDVLKLGNVPDHHYLLNLQAHGPERWLNLRVAGGEAECVNATDAALKGLRGRFEPIGNGVFLISLANDHHRATQFWVVQPDGTAQVKEIPDRHEKQIARPVQDASLESSKESKS